MEGGGLDVYTNLAGYEVKVRYVDGLYEGAIGRHPNLESVGHEGQYIGSHAHCTHRKEEMTHQSQ